MCFEFDERVKLTYSYMSLRVKIWFFFFHFDRFSVNCNSRNNLRKFASGIDFRIGYCTYLVNGKDGVFAANWCRIRDLWPRFSCNHRKPFSLYSLFNYWKHIKWVLDYEKIQIGRVFKWNSLGYKYYFRLVVNPFLTLDWSEVQTHHFCRDRRQQLIKIAFLLISTIYYQIFWKIIIKKFVRPKEK